MEYTKPDKKENNHDYHNNPTYIKEILNKKSNFLSLSLPLPEFSLNKTKKKYFELVKPISLVTEEILDRLLGKDNLITPPNIISEKSNFNTVPNEDLYFDSISKSDNFLYKSDHQVTIPINSFKTNDSKILDFTNDKNNNYDNVVGTNFTFLNEIKEKSFPLDNTDYHYYKQKPSFLIFSEFLDNNYANNVTDTLNESEEIKNESYIINDDSKPILSDEVDAISIQKKIFINKHNMIQNDIYDINPLLAHELTHIRQQHTSKMIEKGDVTNSNYISLEREAQIIEKDFLQHLIDSYNPGNASQNFTSKDNKNNFQDVSEDEKYKTSFNNKNLVSNELVHYFNVNSTNNTNEMKDYKSMENNYTDNTLKNSYVPLLAQKEKRMSPSPPKIDKEFNNNAVNNNLDIYEIAERVYTIIQKKIKIQRQRRGLD